MPHTTPIVRVTGAGAPTSASLIFRIPNGRTIRTRKSTLPKRPAHRRSFAAPANRTPKAASACAKGDQRLKCRFHPNRPDPAPKDVNPNRAAAVPARQSGVSNCAADSSGYTAAGEFVNRQASNVKDAIKRGIRCGGYRFEITTRRGTAG